MVDTTNTHSLEPNQQPQLVHLNKKKLSQQALKAINNPAIRRRLMDILECTEFTIARYIQKNSDNLTKAAPLEIIKEVSGLSDEELFETRPGN